ncbi:MAG: acyltransferase [Actinoplanes sp.]
MQRQTERIVILDGLRLIAALMVVVFHYVGRTKTDQLIWGAGPDEAFPLLHHAAQFGWLGVELFFMISGFVICMSAWDRDTGSFIRSRAIRLFPAYWAAVLLTATVVHLWPTVSRPLPASDVLLNLTMLQWPLKTDGVDGAYWTLWVEARFYLLFGLLVWRGLTRQRAMWFGYGWLLACAITFSANEPLLNVVIQPAWGPLFVAGIAFYLIHRFGSSLKLWGLVVASYLMAQHNMVDRVAAEAKADILGPLSTRAGIAILTGFFVLLGVIAMGWTSRIRWRWLTTAGLLTYPLYLIHQQIGWVIIHALNGHAPRSLVLITTILVMVLAAYLLHRFVEKPIAAALRRRLTSAPQYVSATSSRSWASAVSPSSRSAAGSTPERSSR